MSKITEIREHIEKAHEIRESATGNYRKSLDSFRSGKALINRLFPGSGSKQANSVFDRKSRRELFREIQATTKSYRDALSAAKKQAEDLIHAAAPAPDSEIVDRFERRLADLRTELLLTASPETATQRLRSFIAGIDNPYFANRIRQEYVQLAAPIIESAGSQAGRFKQELSGAFMALKEAALTPEARQAVELHESAEALLQSCIYPQIVKDTISQTLGWKAASFVDTPDYYFTTPEFAENEQVSKAEELQLETAMIFAEA